MFILNYERKLKIIFAFSINIIRNKKVNIKYSGKYFKICIKMSSGNEVQLILKDINEMIEFLKEDAESKIY